MNLSGRHLSLPALTLLMAAFACHAQESGAAATQAEISCHTLMTDRECTEYRTTLSALPQGKARDGYLAQHAALIHEREGLCSCSRAKSDTVIYYPRVKQVALRS